MESIYQPLQDVFFWLIRSSFHGTVLLAIILLVRAVVKKKFRFRMVFWLWMLLLLRLIWPLNLQTTFSVFNLIPQGAEPDRYFSMQAAEEQTATPVSLSNGEATSSLEISDSGVTLPSNTSVDQQDSAVPTRTLPVAVAAKQTRMDWAPVLSTIWLTGALGMVGYVLLSNIRLWRIVKRQRLVTRQDILDLLEDCKDQLGLQTVIGVVETDKIKTPCLFGYLRPRLLLPAGTLEQLTPEQIRYVFLHELAHLKRHDILIGWLMAAVQVLHWFNPAVWYAMTQISADRELACDELTLSTLTDNEPQAYGSTILTFLERFTKKQRLPGMAGIAENQSLLRRRITMISKFKKQKISFVPALVVIALLVATTFTSARSIAKEEVESETHPVTKQTKSKPMPLAQDDGKSGGRESIAGGGHIVWFETEQQMELLGIRLFGSRYGTPQPPKDNFYVWIADEDQNVIETFEYPYAMIKRGNPKWYSMKTKPMQLPQKFFLCIGFNPERTKGVYLHHDTEAGGNSYIGLPHDNFEFKPFDHGDWMIRPVVRPVQAQQTAPSGGPGGMPETTIPGSGYGMPAMFAPAQTDSSNLQAMIDAAEPGAEIEIPAGTYEKPVKITKSLRLKGSSDGKTVLKVTANEPAILIDTKGKGEVHIERLNIQWQLATSDKHELPFSVAVKDTKAAIRNCTFRPLGKPQRSPVAIRAMGFSKMDILDCDFAGFDYVVCYGEGTKGKIGGCFIRNCGHQGVIVYSGAEAEVAGNIITGSKYHAVRSTGGKLDMRDNLIINNKNRGVYLGNKSGSGTIENNLIIGNATGIDGTSACRFKVVNNVILKSEYSAISAIPQARLAIQSNVLADNPRGIIIHQKEDQSEPVSSYFGKNVFWDNQTDMENCEGGEMINQQPGFVEPANGNFKLADPEFDGMGLKDPKVIFDLWQKYQENQ